MSQFEINFDLDGVLANFSKYVHEHTKRPLSLYRSSDELWDELFEHQRLFSKLDVFSDMQRLFFTVQEKFPVRVITARPRRDTFEHAEADKREWVKKHLGDVEVIVCLARDKQEHLRKQKGLTEILIDDLKSNINRWNEAGGVGIHHHNYVDTRDELLKIVGV